VPRVWTPWWRCPPWRVSFLVAGDDLGSVSAPVEYQGGARDITPSVNAAGGCYDTTRAPAELLEFQDAGHLAWTDLVATDHADMIFYARAFFDAPLRGNPRTRCGSDAATWRICG
jgi:hypothetical protein